MNRLSKLFFAFIAAGFFSQAVLATTATAIAAGGGDTCALTTAGAVKCWGSNEYNQLGDNSSTDRDTPVDVTGLSSGVTAIANGVAHTCALTTAGGAKCWGRNSYGQLGDGTATQRNTPVDVVGLSSGVTAIAGGGYHSCAVTTGGGVKCWGDDSNGQLGDNSTTTRFTAVDVVGLSSGVAAIATGDNHSCAVTTAGGVKCWGSNQYGQLGDGSTTDSLTPVDVAGLSSNIAAITTGSDYSCALTSTGGVKCWGDNSSGQLGDNTTTERHTPVDASGLSSGVAAIAAAGYHTCALVTTGGVQCWGDDGYGELGNSTNSNSSIATNVTDLSSGVTAIGSAYYHSCALTTAGRVKCWGGNFAGQLGSGNITPSRVPIAVIGFGAAAIKNDFDGDGKSDALFLNARISSTRYWSGAAKARTITPGAYDLNYIYAGSGDFDGDGKADLFFTRASDHATLIWNGAVKTAVTYPGAGTAGFNVAAICDTDGDGKDDVVWFNPTTGATRIWPAASKAAITYPGSQNTGYSIVACADFDGDKKADLFWRNATTGVDRIWLGGQKSSVLYPGIDTDLTVIAVGAGDIDEDGKSDMVWYIPSTGAIRVWMSGLKATSSYLGTNSTTFTPKAIGDYDGDGKADLLWGNDTTRATQIWPAFTKANVIYPGTYPTGLTIQK
jgi:alpha-tubulin suppressor-like RCC1 family protein